MHALPQPVSAAAIFLASVAFLTGCASTPKTAAAKTATDDKKIVLDETEYEYVTPTGSNIPVRVPKTPIAHPLVTSSEVTTMSPEQFADIVRRGQTSNHR